MIINVIFQINCGLIYLCLYDDKILVMVVSFVNLVKCGYYDGLLFYCVISDFMIQGGCLQGIGIGGLGYKFEDEFNLLLCYDKLGVLLMVNVGLCINGSQFFIIYGVMLWLDGKYSVFGEVVGVDDQKVVDVICQGDIIEKVIVEGDVDVLLVVQVECVKEWNVIFDVCG